MKQGLISIGASLLALALATPVLAQDQVPATTNAQGNRVFEPGFFTQYGPVSALDMVQRIPGFSIAEGEDRRGFGENAGNVLIDGDRPSSKSENILTILGRIPANQVARIELTEQAGGDGETRGQAQIVNVIRKVGNASSGTYEGHFLFGPRYGFTGFATGSLTLKRGNTTYELNAGSFDEKVQGFGPELFQDGARNLSETATYRGRGGYTEFSLGGAIKTQLGGAKVNFNAKAELGNGIDRRDGVFTRPSGTVSGSERLYTDGPLDDLEWEVGGDIEFGLAPKLTTKLIGLYRAERERQTAFVETVRPGLATSRFETENRNRPSEAVFRAQNDWTGLSNHAIQFGAEVAYNQLDSKFASKALSNNVVVGTSRADVLVQETRIEPFVSDVWTVSPQWKIESGAIFEFSKIKLSGDSTARRSFQFVKPRLTATWTASKATTFEFKAIHQIAQLDFGEFATAVDLGQGNQVDKGNSELVPEKVTTFAALVRHKFMDRGSIQFNAEYELLRDTQDLVPIDDGAGGFFDGAGNIGNSRRWNFELEVTLPFDWLTKPLGITGMEVKYVGHYHGSSVTDPVTRLKRPMSFRPEWHQNWAFRHDIDKAGIAWGFNVFAAAPQKAYFVNLFRWQYNAPEVEAFIEYKKFKLGTVRLKVIDFPKDNFRRSRYVYDVSRDGGNIIQIIDRQRKLDPRIQLSLIGKF